MKADCLNIGSVGHVIRVEADRQIINDLKKSGVIENYIPNGAILLDNKSRAKYILSVKNSARVKIFWNKNDHELVLKGKYQKGFSLFDLVTLIEYFFEYIRQKNGIYCLHGSAVSDGQRGILIIGGVSGIGKTTLALNLCLGKDFKFIGDEKILIDERLNLIGGLKSINYNKPQLYESVLINLDGKDRVSLSQFVKIEENKVPLKMILQPILFADSTADLKVEKWTAEKTNFHIYEELTRKIRGVSRRINNYSLPVDSFDTPKLAKHRSRLAAYLSEKVLSYWLAGSFDNMAEFIMQMSDKR